MPNWFEAGKETFSQPYQVEQIISVMLGKPVGRMTLISPLNEVVGIVPDGYTVFDPNAVLSQAEKAFTECKVEIAGYEIRVSDRLDSIVIEFRTEDQIDMAKDKLIHTDKVALNVSISLDLITGSVKVNAYGFRLMTGNLISSFTKPRIAKKGFDSALGLAAVTDAVKSVLLDWKKRHEDCYAKLLDTVHERMPAAAKVQSLQIGKKEMENAYEGVREHFQINQTISEWELINLIASKNMVGSSWLAQRELMKVLAKAFTEDVVMCYHGEAHVFKREA